MRQFLYPAPARSVQEWIGWHEPCCSGYRRLE